MRLLLDEMYPAALAATLRGSVIETTTVAELGLAGRPDDDVMDAATAEGCVLLTENVADFTSIAADRLTAGIHHPGLLIALSSRFSRRPGGRAAIVDAITKHRTAALDDRVVDLEP